MSNLKNKVQLIGRLGQDPEVKTLENGRAVTRFSLATQEVWTDKKGERHENTQWHNVVAWGRTAETIGEYVKKGNEIALEGKLSYGKYEDKNGVMRYTTDIVVDTFSFLGKKAA